MVIAFDFCHFCVNIAFDFCQTCISTTFGKCIYQEI